MTARAFLYDLDGVVVDTAPLHFLAWKKIADELGVDFTERHNERLKGVSRARSLEIILEIGGLALSEPEKAALCERKNRWYVESLSSLSPASILPGAGEFIRLARSRGVRAGLASASRNAPGIVERVGIAALFDAIIDGSQVSRTKPDPEVFLLCAERLGVPADRCVVFEDAAAGIEAARAAGMAAVGIGDPALLGAADIVVPGLSIHDPALRAFLTF